ESSIFVLKFLIQVAKPILRHFVGLEQGYLPLELEFREFLNLAFCDMVLEQHVVFHCEFVARRLEVEVHLSFVRSVEALENRTVLLLIVVECTRISESRSAFLCFSPLVFSKSLWERGFLLVDHLFSHFKSNP